MQLLFHKNTLKSDKIKNLCIVSILFVYFLTMNKTIESEITKLKASRLSFKRPILAYVLSTNGKILEKPDIPETEGSGHQITVFNKWLEPGTLLQDVFEIPDSNGTFREISTGRSKEAAFPAKSAYCGRTVEFHTYTLLPVQFCRLSRLSETTLLALVFSDPALPQIEHYEDPICFFDTDERLCAFNHPFYALLSPWYKEPSLLLGKNLRDCLIETPSQMEEAFFRTFTLPSLSPQTEQLDRFRIANSSRDISLLTWPDEVPFMEKPCVLEFQCRSASGLPPLVLVGNPGLSEVNLLTPDQAGFSIGPDADGQRLLFKRIGYLTAASPALPAAIPGSVQNIRIILGCDFFRYSIDGNEAFSFWNRSPFLVQRQYLNLGVRPGENLELLEFRTGFGPAHDEKPPLPALRFTRLPDRHFAFTYFANPLMRAAARTLRGIILHDVSALHKEIEFEEKKGRELKTRLDKFSQGPVFIGKSAVVRKVLDYGETMAKTSMPILIQGETGTGKSALACYLHSRGPASRKPLVTMDCSTIPHELFESLVFGHMKGSFTGAFADSAGLLEKADHGTVYIDEIQNLSVLDQAKLLHVLQERKITRVGATEPVPLDLRFIISANEDLKARVKAGTFREDLFYRISGVTLRMPPLRERREDLPELCAHFLRTASEEAGRQVESLAPECRALLTAHDWPGNVRELRNVLTHAAVFSTGPVITSAVLRAALDAGRPAAAPETPAEGVGRISRAQFIALLKRHRGRVIPAAREMGVTRHAVYYNLKRFGMSLKEFRQD